MSLESPVVTGTLLLAVVLTAVDAPTAKAHGGGLDAQGCHTIRKTVERQCHRSGGSNTKGSSGLVSGAVTLVSVGNGDTVRLMSRRGKKVTIRLACIDAPKTAQGASGKWSTQTLKNLIQGNSISSKPQVIDSLVHLNVLGVEVQVV